MDPGIFELKTAEDLFKKIEADFDTARKDPLNSCAWFNFFVTAEHFPEWYFKDEFEAKKLRKDHPILRICSHIANGGKHYQVRSKNHSSVGGTAYNYVSGPGLTIEKEFAVNLTEKEFQELGVKSITVLDLAKRIVEFYRQTVY